MCVREREQERERECVYTSLCVYRALARHGHLHRQHRIFDSLCAGTDLQNLYIAECCSVLQCVAVSCDKRGLVVV